MDQDANRLDDDFADALGDDEILILDYDLDAPDEASDGLYSPDESATPIDEVTAGNTRSMVVQDPGGSGKIWAAIGIPLLLLGLAAGVWIIFFQKDKAGEPSPTPTRRTARTVKTPPTGKPVDPPSAVSVASVVSAGDPVNEGPNVGTEQPTATGSDPTNPPGTGATSTGQDPGNPKPTEQEPTGNNPNTAATSGADLPKPTPRPTVDGVAAFSELTLIALNSGFARLASAATNAQGVAVQLKDGRVVRLALGESLIQLKNGNHFKGDITDVNDRFLTLTFAFGKMKIPQGDLNEIVDRNSSDYLPLNAFKSGVVHLKNGNRLRGKIVKITPDRVILGFPSAKIVVSRAALKDGLNSVEYTEADTRERYYGVANNNASNPALGLRPGQRVETLLGVPYYDFEYGFRIVPPKHWTKYTKDAIVGFHATPISPLTGNLALGGLFVSEGELATALKQLPESIGTIPGAKLIGDVKDLRNDSVPWAYQFDCAMGSGKKTDAAPPTKRCRTYIFIKKRKVFVLSVFAFDEKFDAFKDVFALTAKSFEFKN